MSVRFREGGKERVFQQALALCGGEDNERSRLLLETVCDLAAAYCGREDVPEAMEGPLAVFWPGNWKAAPPAVSTR